VILSTYIYLPLHVSYDAQHDTPTKQFWSDAKAYFTHRNMACLNPPPSHHNVLSPNRHSFPDATSFIPLTDGFMTVSSTFDESILQSTSAILGLGIAREYSTTSFVLIVALGNCHPRPSRCQNCFRRHLFISSSSLSLATFGL
jgi:hypothetical protein